MYAQGYVRLRLVLGRHPKINLFGLHYCVVCCEVETKWCFVYTIRQSLTSGQCRCREFGSQDIFYWPLPLWRSAVKGRLK